MVQSTMNNQQPKRDITIVAAISLAALFGILLSSVFDLFRSILDLRYGFEMIRSVFVSAIASVVCLVAPALLVFYVFRYYKNAQQSLLLAIIYGVLAIRPMIASFMWGICYRTDISVVVKSMFSANNLINFAVFAVVALSLGIHFAEKIIPIIVTIAVFLFDFSMFFISEIQMLIYGSPITIYHLENVLWSLGMLALYAALLVIIFQNRKPATTAFVQKQTETEILSVEQQLKNLDEKRALGMITDAEYQEQRKEIIARL